MGILSKIKEMLSKDRYKTLGQIAIINSYDTISIFSGFDEAIKMLEKDPDTNKTKIENLTHAQTKYRKQKISSTGAIRIDELGEITEYKSIEELKKDIK